jgi:hypothetical protein
MIEKTHFLGVNHTFFSSASPWQENTFCTQENAFCRPAACRCGHRWPVPLAIDVLREERHVERSRAKGFRLPCRLLLCCDSFLYQVICSSDCNEKSNAWLRQLGLLRGSSVSHSDSRGKQSSPSTKIVHLPFMCQCHCRAPRVWPSVYGLSVLARVLVDEHYAQLFHRS